MRGEQADVHGLWVEAKGLHGVSFLLPLRGFQEQNAAMVVANAFTEPLQ